MAREIATPAAPPSTFPLARTLVLPAVLRGWLLRHAELATASAVIVAAFLHLMRVYNRGFNLLDEGFVLHVAERVLRGQVPYRDFFTQLTPGAFLTLAAVFKLFGPSVIAGRWVTVGLGLLITALFYTGARRLVSRSTAALAALAFPIWGIAQGWFYPNYSWFALAASAGALVCLLRVIAVPELAEPSTGLETARSRLDTRGEVVRGDEGRRAEDERRKTRDGGRACAWPSTQGEAVRWRWAVGAGFLCGLSAFCKQNMGLYTLVALVAAVLLAGRGSWRRRGAVVAVLVVAALPIPAALIWWLWLQGALAAFYRDAVWIPLAVFPRQMAAPYPPFWPPWPLPTDPPGQAAWSFRLICLLPPLPYGIGSGLVLLGTVLRRAPQAGRARAWWAAFVAWLTFGLGIWATAFPRADFDHVQVALGPVFVVGAALLECAGRLAVRQRVWHLWGAPDEPARAEGAPAWPHARALRLQRLDGPWCRRWLVTLLAGTVLAGCLVAGLGNAHALHMGPRWSLRTLESVSPRAAGILLDTDEAAELTRLITEVRLLSAPDEPIAVLPWNAGLYFLTARPNATRFDLYIPASILPDDLPEIEQSLARARLVVYWTARDTFINNSSLEDRLPELHRYLFEHYRVVAAVNAYRILVRNDG